MDPYMLNAEEELSFFDECDTYDDGNVSNHGLFFYALSSLFLLFFGTLISFTFVSYYIFFVPNLEFDESEDDDEEDDEIPYEYKYVTEFEELMNFNTPMYREQEKTYLSELSVADTTPNGDVVMSYEYDKDDDERSKFTYYSDSKTIPYKYLDTVARKFVCAHKCPNIYVFLKDELMKEMKRMEDEKKREDDRQKMGENDDSLSKKQDSVFASFKNYKTNKSSSIKKRHILVTKNKYKYMGTMEDYNKSLSLTEENKEVKPVSFSEFKKMNSCS